MTHQLLYELEQFPKTSQISSLFKEMMLNFYPKIKSINSRIALDLGFLYIYRKLDNEDEKERLINFWKKNSPSKTIQLPMGEFFYRPYLDFVYLDKIMNGLFIEIALEQFTKFNKLSFIESCIILFDIERYFVVPLSEMDVKIIETIRDRIKNNLPYSNEILSTLLNVRSNYISRRLGYLRNNVYFRVTGTVNYAKIGLNLYLILINSSPKISEQIPEFFTSPYTRTIRRCPNQYFDYIISLTLPQDIEIKLGGYLEQLKHLGKIQDYYFDQVTSISHNIDFSYYVYSKRPSVLSATKPGFHIDWFKERILSMTDISTNGENSYHRFFFEGSPVKLSSLDLKVMTLYRRDLDSSVRTIAKQLSLSWDEANIHMTRVKPVLFPMILLYYMGLNQTTILFFKTISQSSLHSLETVLKRMPQTFSYALKGGGAIVTVDLMNGSHRLNDLICEVMPELRNAQFSLASKTRGIFRPIPYKFFDEETNKWFFPENFFLFKELK